MKRSQQHSLLYSSLILSVLLIISVLAASNRISPECRAALSLPRASTDTAIHSSASASAAFCLPWRTDLWEKAAHQSLQAGDPALAVRLLERARLEATRFSINISEPLTLQGLEDLAYAYQQTGEFDSALKTWDSITSFTGLNDESAAKIASLNWALGDVSSAAEIWGKLAQIQPANPEVLYEYGRHLATRDPEAGLIELNKAVDLDPQMGPRVSGLRQAIMSARLAGDPAYTLLNLGRAFAASQEWAFAAEAFRQSILKRPDYAEAWAFLGEARQHLPSPAQSAPDLTGISSDGLFELQTAVELDPESISAQTFLALYWIRRSRSDLALDAIRAAVAQSPENPNLVAELARLQAFSGDLDDAYQTYQHAASLAPQDPEFLRQIIRFSIDYNYNPQQIALVEARRLVADYPNDPINLDLMAQVLISLGDLANAERFLIRLLEVDPASASAYLHLGLVYLLRSDSPSARVYLERARSLDPGGSIGLQAQRLMEGGSSLPSP